MVTCKICKRQFGNRRGLSVHMGIAHQNNKRAKKEQHHAIDTTNGETLLLSIPCDVGGNKFGVDIALKLEAMSLSRC